MFFIFACLFLFIPVVEIGFHGHGTLKSLTAVNYSNAKIYTHLLEYFIPGVLLGYYSNWSVLLTLDGLWLVHDHVFEFEPH